MKELYHHILLLESFQNLNFNTFIIDSREDYLNMTNIKDINYSFKKTDNQPNWIVY